MTELEKLKKERINILRNIDQKRGIRDTKVSQLSTDNAKLQDYLDEVINDLNDQLEEHNNDLKEIDEKIAALSPTRGR